MQDLLHEVDTLRTALAKPPAPEPLEVAPTPADVCAKFGGAHEMTRCGWESAAAARCMDVTSSTCSCMLSSLATPFMMKPADFDLRRGLLQGHAGDR